jgi:hypothetical protein
MPSSKSKPTVPFAIQNESVRSAPENDCSASSPSYPSLDCLNYCYDTLIRAHSGGASGAVGLLLGMALLSKGRDMRMPRVQHFDWISACCGTAVLLVSEAGVIGGGRHC